MPSSAGKKKVDFLRKEEGARAQAFHADFSADVAPRRDRSSSSPTSRRHRPGPHTSRTLPFFFNATATTEIYTLSLHDALPISRRNTSHAVCPPDLAIMPSVMRMRSRSEEHTSELQSRRDLVCRLLLEKKK